jgi:hypothetical protein
MRGHLKIYQVIRENGGWDQFDMVAVKTMVCSKQEALIEEEHIRIELNAKLNSNRAVFITEEERREQLTKLHAEYYQQHKEQIVKYRQQNKEQNAKYHAEYRQQNSEKLTQKFDCECGGKYAYQSKSTHSKSNRHKIYLANLLKN